MNGTIKAYSSMVNAGVIECESGNTYGFRRGDWHGKDTPIVNDRVQFEGANRTAVKVSATG